MNNHKSKRELPAKRERAVALQYKALDELPVVSASGVGEIARRIIELAKSHDIPIEQNQELAGMLTKLEVGDSITPETYKLVAEVVAFLYFIDKKWREKHPFLDELAP